MDSPVIINPGNNPRFSVIWLHGLGADGNDFVPLVNELQFPTKNQTRFIFPHAPVMPVTINNGMRMRAWYDISQADLGNQIDRKGIESSSKILNDLLRQEVESGIPTSKIVLAGFSQGGVIALHCGLRQNADIAGILALSTYTSDSAATLRELVTMPHKPPILMMHGQYDPVVPESLARLGLNLLKDAGYNVDWKTYPMPHSVCPQQLIDINTWFEQRFYLD